MFLLHQGSVSPPLNYSRATGPRGLYVNNILCHNITGCSTEGLIHVTDTEGNMDCFFVDYIVILPKRLYTKTLITTERLTVYLYLGVADVRSSTAGSGYMNRSPGGKS